MTNATCPICDQRFLIPRSVSRFRSRIGYADRAYHYHKTKEGRWCLSNGVKLDGKK